MDPLRALVCPSVEKSPVPGKRALESRTRTTQRHRGRIESFADDLRTSRGVVPGRAAFTLRSNETLPLTGEFVHTKMGNVPVLMMRSFRNWIRQP